MEHTITMSFFFCILVSLFLPLVSPRPTTETDIVTEILKVIDGRDEMQSVVNYLKESRQDLVKELPLVSQDGTKLSYTLFAPTSNAFQLQIPQDTVDPLAVDASLRNKVLLRHFARQSISSDELTKLDKLVMADSKEVVLSGKSGIKVCDLPPIENTAIQCAAFVPSWTFNSKSGKCEAYVYGGCLKTENLFDTEEACLAKCGPEVNIREKLISYAKIQPEPIQLSQDFGVVYFIDRAFMNNEEITSSISDHYKRNPNTVLCLGLPCSDDAPVDISMSSNPTIESDIVTDILKVIDGRDEMRRVVSYLKESRQDLVKELPLVSQDGTKLSYTFFAPTSNAFQLQIPQDTVDPLAVDASLRNKVLIRHFARQSISSDELTKLDKLVMADSKEVVLSEKSGIEVCDLPPVENPGNNCEALIPSWTFNSKSGRCEAFDYGGCLKTENLFGTEETCLAKCGPRVNIKAKLISDARIQPETISQNFGVVYFIDRVFMDDEEVNTAISDYYKRNPNTILCLGLPCSSDVAILPDAGEPELDISNTPLAPPPDSPILLGGYRVISSDEPDVQVIAQFATKSLSQGANKASPFLLVQVVKAERQVVVGFNYRLQMELKETLDSTDVIACNVVVYDPPGTTTLEITSSDCNPSIVFVQKNQITPALEAEEPNKVVCLDLPCSSDAPLSVDEPNIDIRDTPPPPVFLVVGGYSAVLPNDTDVQEMAQFATKSLSQGANKASPFLLVQVVKAERQVVAGYNYRLQMELKETADSNDVIVCNVIIYDQSWTSTRQMTSSNCNPSIVIVPKTEIIAVLPSSSDVPLPVIDVTPVDESQLEIDSTTPPPDNFFLAGGYGDVLPNNTNVQEMAQFATEALSRGANKAPPFILVQVVKAETQVVSGYNYRLQMKLKETADSNDVIVCNVVVYDQSWTFTRLLTSFNCDPSLDVDPSKFEILPTFSFVTTIISESES